MNNIKEIDVNCRDISMMVSFDGKQRYVATRCNINLAGHGCQYLLSVGECPRGYGIVG